MTYENLVQNDLQENGKFKGQLAKDWFISPNGSVYTFHLKEDIKYQDGTPFNAYTMKYSLDRMMILNDISSPAFILQRIIVGGPEISSTNDLNVSEANNYLQAGGVTALDEFTLQIKILEPYEPFLATLAYIPSAVSPYSIIINKPENYTTNRSDDIWGMISLKNMFPDFSDWTKLGLPSNHDPAISGIVPQSVLGSDTVHKWMLSHMIGTGPYILNTYTDEEIQYIKNNDWHGEFAQNAPDEIIWQAQNSSYDVNVKFLTGEIDELDTMEWQFDEIASYLDSSGNSLYDGIKVYKQLLPNTWEIRFNFNENLTRLVVPSPSIGWNQTYIINEGLVRLSTNSTYYASPDNPFTALKFREAFSTVFDYDAYIKEEYNDYFAERAEGVIAKGIFGHNDQLIEKGLIPSQNLTKAGQLFKEVGWEGNITLLNNYTQNDPRSVCFNLIKTAMDYLDVGINIIIEQTNRTYYIQNYANFPFYVGGYAADYSDPDNMVYSMLDSQGFFSLSSNYSNPEVDKLIEQAKSEHDFNTRLNLYKNIEGIAASDYQSIYLVQRFNVFLFHDWLSNIEESGSMSPFSWGLKYQYISKVGPVTTTNNSLFTSTQAKTPGFEAMFLLSLLLLLAKKKSRIKK